MRKTIAFIGVGNMANAIINGITKRENNPFPFSNLILFDKYPPQLKSFENTGAKITESITDAVKNADCVVLSVKPQNFPEVLTEISSLEGISEKLFITIAAGIEISTIKGYVGSAPVIRVLPNLPMVVGFGVSAICKDDSVHECDFEFVADIFAASGKVIKIDESEMNRIISVTSSSPAYIFMLIDSMLGGAKSQGLVESFGGNISEKEMLLTICDTIIGACELMKASDCSAKELISRVASKGGTTERAINELEAYKFKDGIISAMQKCTDRADELGKS